MSIIKIPIFLPDNYNQDREKGAFLWTSGYCLFDNDTIWFVPYNYNCLVQYDLVTGNIVKNILLKGSNCIKGTHYNLVKHGHYIVLIPARDMNVFIYDIECAELHRLPLIGEEDRKEKYITFSVWNNFIYCFPLNRTDILRVDVSTLSVQFIKWDRACEYLKDKEDFVEHSATIGSKVYLLVGQSNSICEFDMETESERFFSVGEAQTIYTRICQYGKDGLVLVEKNGHVVVLNSSKQIVSRKKILELGERAQCVIWDKGNMLFDSYDTMFYWDEINEIKIILDIQGEYSGQDLNYAPYSRLSVGTKYVAVFYLPLQVIFIINKKSFDIRVSYICNNQFSKIFIEELFLDECRREIMLEDSIDVISVGNLLKTLTSTLNHVTEKPEKQQLAGKLIYNMVCKRVL